MARGDYRFIWERPDWPEWTYDLASLADLLAECSRAQGMLVGRLTDVGLALRNEASLEALTSEVTQSSAIEGEELPPESVRSSLARRLGMDAAGLETQDRRVEGVVEMVLDGTAYFALPLTEKRLHSWHGALFPTGYSGLRTIRVAQWRTDESGPMRVLSGPAGKERIHYEAPPASRLSPEMDAFFHWFNGHANEPPLIRAGLGHLWFVTIHPYEDGNGRIARALGDMLLARAEDNSHRFYSLSAQIKRERAAYYDILERTQRGSLDVTEWLKWFLHQLMLAQDRAHGTVDRVLRQARFWQHFGGVTLNPRQAKVLKGLLGDLEELDGRMTVSRWASMNHCSKDTALRDIQDLEKQGILVRTAAGGRSTAYRLAEVP
jgi:Fic family protein